MDSTVLLHLGNQTASEFSFPIKAIHINHNLHSNAVLWSSHCDQVCADYSILCETVALGLPENNKNPEERARQARYDALAGFVEKGDLLLVGHHRDDQAETLLLQLLRGAGSRGLAAMPHCKLFARGRLLRPLLDYPRSDIFSYARDNNLKWIEDGSNRESAFDRNFLRSEIIPHIKRRWPNMSRVLQRSAAHQAEVVTLLDEIAHDDLLDNQREHGGAGLSLPHFFRLSLHRQKQLLMHWLRKSHFNVPSERKISTIIKTVLTARIDSNPVITWSGAMLYRYRDQIFVIPPLPAERPESTALTWKLNEVLALPLGSLHATPVNGSGIRRCDVGDQLKVVFRHGKEQLAKGQEPFRKSLKNLLQEKGVPSCYRNFLPLIAVHQEVALIPRLWCATSYQARVGEVGWLIEWRLPRVYQRTLFSNTMQIS